MSEARRFHYRSFFWPMVLIGVGVVWLLANMGILNASNVAVLDRIWPLILIGIGLDLLFGRQSGMLGAVIGIGMVAVIVVLMLIGPSIGLSGMQEPSVGNYSAPIGDAQSATVNINASLGDLEVRALEDSPNLIEAHLLYLGEVAFDVTGETQKVVSLGQVGTASYIGGPFSGLFGLLSNRNLRWEVGLNPDIPLTLSVDGSVGDADLDLTGLQLTSLDISGGVGDTRVTVPALEGMYTARISGSVGEVHLIIPEDTALDANISGGVGDVSIDIPDDAAVQIAVSSGLGNVDLPPQFSRVGGGDDDEDGTWQTADFTSAERHITITFSAGVGSLDVR